MAKKAPSIEQEKLARMAHEHAIKQAKNRLASMQNDLRTLADALGNRIATLDDGGSVNMPTPPSTKMQWAINDVENLIRNLNFATLAMMTAELRATELLTHEH